MVENNVSTSAKHLAFINSNPINNNRIPKPSQITTSKKKKKNLLDLTNHILINHLHLWRNLSRWSEPDTSNIYKAKVVCVCVCVYVSNITTHSSHPEIIEHLSSISARETRNAFSRTSLYTSQTDAIHNHQLFWLFVHADPCLVWLSTYTHTVQIPYLNTTRGWCLNALMMNIESGVTN